jgi:hypothetical protein
MCSKLNVSKQEDDPGDGEAKPLVSAMDDFLDAINSGDPEALAVAFKSAQNIVALDDE